MMWQNEYYTKKILKYLVEIVVLVHINESIYENI